MKTATPTIRVAMASFCLLLVPSAEVVAKGKPGGGGGDGGSAPPPNPEIAFIQSPRNQPDYLVLANADGSNATTVYSAAELQFVDMSPTADELVFSDVDGGNSSLKLLRYTYDVSGIVASAPVGLVSLSGSTSISPDISPDGNYVLYRVLGQGVFLRSMDPNVSDARLIYNARAVSSAVWLVAADGYKIAFCTTDPGDANEREIFTAEIDPSEPDGTQVIQSIGATVLATASKPFRITGAIESARTSESVVTQAIYRSEYFKTKPVLMAASRPVIWDVATDNAVALVSTAGEERDFKFPVLSPDDSKLMVVSFDSVKIFNLGNQTSTTVGSGAIGDWKPTAQPAP